MKIKTTGEKDLLEVLEWKNDYKRENIINETDSTKIEIYFWDDHKEVMIAVKGITLIFDTKEVSPETINEFINLTLDWAGVEYED